MNNEQHHAINALRAAIYEFLRVFGHVYMAYALIDLLTYMERKGNDRLRIRNG